MVIGSGMSYRKGLDLINRLLHRNAESSIKFRTYRDFCERSGKQIENYIDCKSNDILKAHGFDTESGKPVGVPAAELTLGAKPYTDKAVKSAIEKINTERHSPDEQIKSERLPIEDSQETVYISLDDIGVKHQKEHRSEETEKNGVYVGNVAK